MPDILKEILAVDAAAVKRLKAAEAERNEALSSLNAKKEALIEEEKRMARKKAEALSLEKKREDEKMLENIRKQNAVIMEQMENLYREKKEDWVEMILQKVLQV